MNKFNFIRITLICVSFMLSICGNSVAKTNTKSSSNTNKQSQSTQALKRSEDLTEDDKKFIDLR